MKKVFVLLLASLLILNFQAKAQLGKKLKNKLESKLNGEGGSSKKKSSIKNKSKLPGPYMTTNVELEAHSKGHTEFFINKTEDDNEINVAVHPAKFMYREYTAMELSSDKYEKKHLMKFADEGETIFSSDDKPYLKENGSWDSKFCRAIKMANDVYLVYYGELSYPIEKHGQTIATGYMKSIKHFVLAPSQELVDEWSGEKGLTKIKAFEAKVKANHIAAETGELDKVRMPAEGKMHKNTALYNEISKYVKGVCNRDNTTLKRIVIVSNDWENVTDKYTGKILYRRVLGYFADSRADRTPTECMVFYFYFIQKYDGTKYIQDNPTFNCCSQDLRFGPDINCENVNK